MTFISYAQNFEDVMLWRAFRDVDKGFYIDIGAQDPMIDSVSLAFHERGWKGIHVEASAHYAGLLREQRPGDVVIQAAVSDSISIIPFYEIADSGISTTSHQIASQHRARGFIVQEMRVPSISLSAVFEACSSDVIHWLKIDIEGSERAALSTWGNGKRRPYVVIVESTLPSSQIESSEDWQSFLLDRGYEPVYFDGLNRYFVAEERPELKLAFGSPPNVFDNFAFSGTASSSFHQVIDPRRADELASIRAELESTKASLASDAQQRESLEKSLNDARNASLERERSAGQTLREAMQQGGAERMRLLDHQAELIGTLRAAQDAQHNAQAECASATGEVRLVRQELASLRTMHASLVAELEDRRVLLQAHAERFGECQREWELQRRGVETGHAAEVARLTLHLEQQTAKGEHFAKQFDKIANLLTRIHGHPIGRLLMTLDRTLRAPADTPSLQMQIGADSNRQLPADVSASFESIRSTGYASESIFFSSIAHLKEFPLLDRLTALNDVDFVRAAYRSILKREADPSGERNYVELLCAGRHKVDLIRDISSSEEGRRAGVVIPGLPRALRMRRLARVPLFGPPLQKLLDVFRRKPDLDPVSAYRNQTMNLLRTTLNLMVQVQTKVQDLTARQDELTLTVNRLAQAGAVSVDNAGSTQPLDGRASGDGPLDSITQQLMEVQLLRKAAAWKT